ncbi:Hpt domain-containing protein, partial [Pseudomonas savastanoi]
DLHTLKGGARMAEVAEVGDLAHELENLYEGLIDRRFNHSPALAELLHESHDHLAILLEQLYRQEALSDPSALIEALGRCRSLESSGADVQAPPAASEDPPEHDTELREVFLEEGFDIIESSGAALARWQADPHNLLEVENLLRDLHTLK